MLSGGLITEADDWKAAAVVVPPGQSMSRLSTLVSSGMLGVMYRIGLSGTWVRTLESKWIHY